MMIAVVQHNPACHRACFGTDEPVDALVQQIKGQRPAAQYRIMKAPHINFGTAALPEPLRARPGFSSTHGFIGQRLAGPARIVRRSMPTSTFCPRAVLSARKARASTPIPASTNERGYQTTDRAARHISIDRRPENVHKACDKSPSRCQSSSA